MEPSHLTGWLISRQTTTTILLYSDDEDSLCYMGLGLIELAASWWAWLDSRLGLNTASDSTEVSWRVQYGSDLQWLWPGSEDTGEGDRRGMKQQKIERESRLFWWVLFSLCLVWIKCVLWCVKVKSFLYVLPEKTMGVISITMQRSATPPNSGNFF